MKSGNIRIGHSFDIHRLVENRPLIIGGVNVPHTLGALAHSDGDVLLHAITEAIIGALGLGDLGHHFPGTAEYKDISSILLLQKADKMMKEKHYQIINIDASVYLEKPRLFTYIPQMINSIQQTLNITAEQINIKAGTMEQIGAIGRGEAIGAAAVVLLERK